MSRPRSVLIICVAVLAIGLAGCSRNDGRDMKAPLINQNESIAIVTTAPAAPTTAEGDDLATSAMTLLVPWEPDDEIDISFTCDGVNSSPALTWSGIDPTVGALALVLSDDDAPNYLHWVVANIAPTTGGFVAGGASPESVVAKNSGGVVGYTGPCPPKGTVHSYALTLYALDQMLKVQPGDDAITLRNLIEEASTDLAVSTFTYQR